MSGDPERRAPFYIGYLPMPPALRAFALWIAAGAMLLGGVVAFLFAVAQRDPGTGVWEAGVPTELIGWFVLAPYPAIEVVEGPEALVGRTVVIVSQGKMGAQDRIAPLAGQLGRARGALIARGGIALLELEGGLGAAEEVAWTAVPMYAVRGTAAPPNPPDAFAEELGPRTLQGEIIDSKCALGVMKPGTGKAHKDCAALCLFGGVPPMFLVRDGKGHFDAYVIAGADGGPVDRAAILPYAADPVEVAGTLARAHGLVVFRIDPAAIRRL
ncbi:MAG: hypothetical protein H6923_00645 [Alphaproteobacteria bacterium]|nr:hypothetical protein [Alphaproteobacteria bacterium]